MKNKDINILLLEDNPGDARLVLEMLKESRHLIFKATHVVTLKAGLEEMARESFDIVILDLDVPDSHGLETLDNIVKLAPAIPAIVLTGNTEEELGLRAIQRKASDYLVKGEISTFSLVRSIRYAIERKRMDETLLKLNRMLWALSESSQAMMRAENESGYLQNICRIIVETCGYSMVWIGYATEDEAKSVRPVAQSGFDEGYIKTLDITWAYNERGRGPTGTAIRTGKPAMCRNILVDPNFKPWREEAIKRGYASSIVLPLMEKEKAFGSISIYSKEADPFSEEEIKLLEELSGDLAYGIRILRIRAKNIEAEKILRRDKETLETLVKERSQELIDAQMELDKARRLSDIGTLAATVAHELRNPLAAMRMAAFNIKRKANNPLLDNHLENIEKKITESDQIINNLLFYSRIKSPHLERIKIYDILEECIQATQKQSKKRISFKKSLGPIKNVLIDADSTQLKEVFHNILNNAHDAIAERQGKIEVWPSQEEEFIKIAFKDNGSGIDKENLDKVFDPFFTTKAKGTGLGLSVCQQIVSLHGGAINIESELGKGTTVTVSLPGRIK